MFQKDKGIAEAEAEAGATLMSPEENPKPNSSHYFDSVILKLIARFIEIDNDFQEKSFGFLKNFKRLEQIVLRKKIGVESILESQMKKIDRCLDSEVFPKIGDFVIPERALSTLLEALEESSIDLRSLNNLAKQYTTYLKKSGLTFNDKKNNDIEKISLVSPEKAMEMLKSTPYNIPLKHRIKKIICRLYMPESQMQAQTKNLLKVFNALYNLSEKTLTDLIFPLEEIICTKPPYFYAQWIIKLLSTLWKKVDPQKKPITTTLTFVQETLKFGLERRETNPEENSDIDLSVAFKKVLQMTMSPHFKSLPEDEKEVLTQLFVRTVTWSSGATDAEHLVELLSTSTLIQHRHLILTLLVQAENYSAYLDLIACCNIFSTMQSDLENLRSAWSQTAQLWLEYLKNPHYLASLYEIINALNTPEMEEKKEIIIHIIAWSTLNRGLKSEKSHERDKEKLPKLFAQLKIASMEKLKLVAGFYSGIMVPSGDTLRFILKTHQDESQLQAIFSKFPSLFLAEDKGISAIRHIDSLRILSGIIYQQGNKSTSLTAEQQIEISDMRLMLALYQSNKKALTGSSKKISELNLAQLKKIFFEQHALAYHNKNQNEVPSSLIHKTAMLAVLFEIMHRTIGIYPNLAQQIACLAGEYLTSDFCVVKSQTGEGKSILIALQAAILAADAGQQVEITTSNSMLALRDLKQFKPFFEALGYKAACINGDTSVEAVEPDIWISTEAGISLWRSNNRLTHRTQEKNDGRLPPKRIADEADAQFIKYSALNNLSRSDGIISKEDLEVFYKEVNIFYVNHMKSKEFIDVPILKAFYRQLLCYAGTHVGRQMFIKSLSAELLVLWLKSAYAAHHLQKDIDFTIRPISGNDEKRQYEITPLKNNHPMIGAIFASGVQQLLESHHRDIQKNNEIIISPFAEIVVSRILLEECHSLAKIQGYTGTWSEAQTDWLEPHLKKNTRIQTLTLPTNKASLRHWERPDFFELDLTRDMHLLDLITECLNHNKSLLVITKNDRETIALVKRLERLIKNDAHKGRLLHYINSSTETPEAFLDRKKQMGSTIVIAASFERGANVGVNSVVILDPTDNNDRKQKGGRTARNGEAGVVLQLYLKNDILKLHHNACEQIAHYLSAQQCKKLLADFPIDNVESEDLPYHYLERLLILTEHLDFFKNQELHGYQKFISTVSAWGIEISSSIINKAHHRIWTTRLIALLKTIEKKWEQIKNKSEGVTHQDRMLILVKYIDNHIRVLFNHDADCKPFLTKSVSMLQLSDKVASFHALTKSSEDVVTTNDFITAKDQTAVDTLNTWRMLCDASGIPQELSISEIKTLKSSAKTLYALREGKSLLHALKITTVNAANIDSKYAAHEENISIIATQQYFNLIKPIIISLKLENAAFQENVLEFTSDFLKGSLLTDEQMKVIVQLVQYLCNQNNCVNADKMAYVARFGLFIFIPAFQWVPCHLSELNQFFKVDDILSLAAFVDEIASANHNTNNDERGVLFKQLIRTFQDLNDARKQCGLLSLLMTPAELHSFLPIYCDLIQYAKRENPGAEKVIFNLWMMTLNKDYYPRHKEKLIEIWKILHARLFDTENRLTNLASLLPVVVFCNDLKGKSSVEMMSELFQLEHTLLEKPESLLLFVKWLLTEIPKKRDQIDFIKKNNTAMAMLAKRFSDNPTLSLSELLDNVSQTPAEKTTTDEALLDIKKCLAEIAVALSNLTMLFAQRGLNPPPQAQIMRPDSVASIRREAASVPDSFFIPSEKLFLNFEDPDEVKNLGGDVVFIWAVNAATESSLFPNSVLSLQIIDQLSDCAGFKSISLIAIKKSDCSNFSKEEKNSLISQEQAFQIHTLFTAISNNVDGRFGFHFQKKNILRKYRPCLSDLITVLSVKDKLQQSNKDTLHEIAMTLQILRDQDDAKYLLNAANFLLFSVSNEGEIAPANNHTQTKSETQTVANTLFEKLKNILHLVGNFDLALALMSSIFAKEIYNTMQPPQNIDDFLKPTRSYGRFFSDSQPALLAANSVVPAEYSPV